MSSYGSRQENLELLSYSPDKESVDHSSSDSRLIQSKEKYISHFRETIEVSSHLESSPVYSYYTLQSPLYVNSNFFNESPKVFDRLIKDANKRTNRKMMISELIKNNDINSAPRYTENEQVYGRLLKDSKLRQEQAKFKEYYKKLIEEEEILRYKSKTKLTKSQTSAVITRLVRNFQVESPRKDVDQKYLEFKQSDFTKTLNIDSMMTLPYTPRLNTDRSFKTTPRNCGSSEKVEKSKLEQDKTKTKTISMLERTELEKCYGKPGKPQDPNEKKSQALSPRDPPLPAKSLKKIPPQVLANRVSRPRH